MTKIHFETNNLANIWPHSFPVFTHSFNYPNIPSWVIWWYLFMFIYALTMRRIWPVYYPAYLDTKSVIHLRINNNLNFQVPKTLAKQPFVRELYIQYAINQQDIVQKAANINVTKHLNAEMSGYLPLHCICAMLHWRSFSKYSTPIQVMISIFIFY